MTTTDPLACHGGTGHPSLPTVRDLTAAVNRLLDTHLTLTTEETP